MLFLRLCSGIIYSLLPCYYSRQAFSDLIASFGWKSFTILYQDNQGLVRLQELLKASTDSDLRTIVHQLSFDGKDDNKKILREVKKSGAVHIVLDCELENIRSVLKDAQVL